jgi:GNAT superfamily N-acetyltransferase
VVAHELRGRVDATLTHYHQLGLEPRLGPLAIGTRDPSRDEVWDANQIRSVRASEPDEIEAVLAWADELYAGTTHRRVAIDGNTPDPFEARLALDGWTMTPVIQAVLSGPLAHPRPGEGTLPAGVAIRPAETDADWATMVRLTRLDHLEEAAKESRPSWDEALTASMVGHRRRKAPAVRQFIASLDGADVGMFSALPGLDGMGLVEDLFVAPEARRHGVAVALIGHCVDDARARGADEVIIGSDPDDWPKGLYARLGFRPCFVERLWDLELGLP